MGQQHSRTGALSNHRLSGERGQTVVFVLLLLVAVIGVVGVVIDIGYAYRTQRALQSAADASALAGAQQLPDPTSATQVAQQYGTSAAGFNKISNVAVTEKVTTSCLATIPGCLPVNEVSVNETASIPTFFSQILGIKSFSVHVGATACSPCGSQPEDIMLVLDRTGSMCQDSLGKADASCTDLNNAKAGLTTFLSYFNPAVAHVGLAVLPPATSVSTRCSTPASANYNSTSAAYTVVPLSSDYKLPNGTLNTSSTLVSTVNCLKGAGSTAYANAIDAAQAELNLHGRPHVPRVIVFFSDGAANTGPSYLSSTSPYRTQPCHQGGTSAAVAKAAGTTIYSIGYALDDDTGGCKNGVTGSAESPGINVYQALGAIASSPSMFHVKPSAGELQTIYSAIAADISHGSSSLIN
jgi:hypothetical protein